jgi:hypothetical protein
MGWMPAADGIEMCQSDVGERHLKEKASMDEVTIVGLDLAKRVFQLHGARCRHGGLCDGPLLGPRDCGCGTQRSASAAGDATPSAYLRAPLA